MSACPKCGVWWEHPSWGPTCGMSWHHLSWGPAANPQPLTVETLMYPYPIQLVPPSGAANPVPRGDNPYAPVSPVAEVSGVPGGLRGITRPNNSDPNDYEPAGNYATLPVSGVPGGPQPRYNPFTDGPAPVKSEPDDFQASLFMAGIFIAGVGVGILAVWTL